MLIPNAKIIEYIPFKPASSLNFKLPALKPFTGAGFGPQL
jgi:hypothetical protein